MRQSACVAPVPAASAAAPTAAHRCPGSPAAADAATRLPGSRRRPPTGAPPSRPLPSDRSRAGRWQRPLAELPAAERADRFCGPAAPCRSRPDTIYLATIVTDKGNIVAELYPDTPESANNFVTLAQNGFYDGLTFHRVEPGFVIQGGDPKGDGGGGPGYTIPAEIKHNHPRGALAWARTGDQVNPERRSSGSQFYITLDETPFLDGRTPSSAR